MRTLHIQKNTYHFTRARRPRGGLCACLYIYPSFGRLMSGSSDFVGVNGLTKSNKKQTPGCLAYFSDSVVSRSGPPCYSFEVRHSRRRSHFGPSCSGPYFILQAGSLSSLAYSLFWLGRTPLAFPGYTHRIQGSLGGGLRDAFGDHGGPLGPEASIWDP